MGEGTGGDGIATFSQVSPREKEFRRLLGKPAMADAASATRSGLSPSQDAKPNILVVDDREENLLATERVLRPLGATLFKASSGNEALSLIPRHRFAVVLLDVQMPETDGFETATLMHEHDSMRGVPIIFVTTVSKDECHVTRAAVLGAVDTIFKPINTEILKSKVKVYLDLYIQREEILKLNDVLRQNNEELERFAYICSHDLQEPVRMMNSYAELLADECAEALNEKGHRYLACITAGAERMHTMIQDILSFSRVGREQVKVERVDSNRIVSEVLAEFDSVIRKKEALITVGSLPTLETSPTLLRVLFQNLIGNALKFQDRRTRPAIDIQAERSEGAWLFSVRDNGIGIDPEFGEKIFAIFQRLHRKEDYPGTGIGLSTCRKLIQLYGGTIGFNSAPGQGAVFFFSLPE
jgi:two-component system, sensor histidine kinase and response regulator